MHQLEVPGTTQKGRNQVAFHVHRPRYFALVRWESYSFQREQYVCLIVLRTDTRLGVTARR